MGRLIDISRRANQAAVSLRDRIGLDDIDPVNPWDIARSLGVKVRFLNTNMEGMYFVGTPPRILQTSLRPMGRRAFTCGHELGHHEFGHGTRLDTAIAELTGAKDSNEQLVDAFAAFLLMPSIGIRRAFAERGWSIANPSPMQVFVVACEFGVGYETMLLYLEVILRVLPAGKKAALARVTPKAIRTELLGKTDAKALVILDGSSRCTTVEIEIGTTLVVPEGACMEGRALQDLGRIGVGREYRAVARGTATLTGSVAAAVRVWPVDYAGLADFRALEE